MLRPDSEVGRVPSIPETSVSSLTPSAERGSGRWKLSSLFSIASIGAIAGGALAWWLGEQLLPEAPGVLFVKPLLIGAGMCLGFWISAPIVNKVSYGTWFHRSRR